jgi:periplasmic protein TonB
LGGVLLVALVVFGLIWMIRGMKKSDQPKRQVAQKIELIRPPPPPPEPPPPPPPPEEKIEEPLPQETPEEAPPDEAAPAEQLGLDAEGVAGADGFGLAAVRAVAICSAPGEPRSPGTRAD